jgi:Phage head-tail joining protein
MRSDIESLDQQIGDAEEQRAMSVAVPAEGGYTVPDGFGNQIIETMQDFGGVLSAANVMTTATGNDIHFPSNDDTANTGTLRYKIRIERQSITRDTFGQPQETWIVIAERRASIEPLNGREFFTGNLLYPGTLSQSKTINNGDSALSFLPGALTVTES